MTAVAYYVSWSGRQDRAPQRAVETPASLRTAAETPAGGGFTQWPRDIAERTPQIEPLQH
jgi:hypothetical protein